MLFPEQQEFVDKVLKAKKGRFLLQGGAGTGKTHTVAHLIEELAKEFRLLNVVMTAPTHTAVKVLDRFVETREINAKNVSVSSCTIHSLLGLFVKTIKGKQVLVKRRDKEAPIHGFDVLVIDESSMIGEDIWNPLSEALHKYQGLVIFMGDIAQLKPVTDYGTSKDSPVFSLIKNVHTLTTSRRTEYDNPAFELINKYREASLNEQMVLTVNSKLNEEHKGYMYCDSKDLWYKLLVGYAQQGINTSNTNLVKAIAYTNNRVNDINNIVRGNIYGYDAPQYVKDEFVIAGTAILDSEGNIIIHNNEEFRVEILSEELCSMTKLPVFWVQPDKPGVGPLKVINYGALEAKDNYFKKLANKCKSNPSLWDTYWEEYNSFADIRYSYAITAHKSQGSTYTYVFIDQDNIAKIKDASDRAAAAYVAVSRMTDRVHFY